MFFMRRRKSGRLFVFGNVVLVGGWTLLFNAGVGAGVGVGGVGRARVGSS